MTWVVAVSPSAARDIADARDYYAPHGVDEAFELDLHRAFELLATRALAYPVVYADVRRALCRRFPFSIFFIIESARVVVLGVQHQRRNPAARPPR